MGKIKFISEIEKNLLVKKTCISISTINILTINNYYLLLFYIQDTKVLIRQIWIVKKINSLIDNEWKKMKKYIKIRNSFCPAESKKFIHEYFTNNLILISRTKNVKD